MAPTPTMGSSGRHPLVTADRISSLPDERVHTIMSFLTTQEAVQTCVLSRRWEKLWCSMPCLDIDQEEFNLTASGGTGDGERDSASARFAEFVDNLLMFHTAQSLDRFRFHADQDRTLEPKVVDGWLRRGIKCCPAVVDIDVGPFCAIPRLDSTACRLKRLHLAEMWLCNNFTQQLPSGCPVLDDLKLERCVIASPEITSCTLTNLIITGCQFYSGRGKALTITAPALVYFQLVITAVGLSWDGIWVNEMPSLVKASICLIHRGRAGNSSKKGPCKLLCSLINVRNLELSGSKTLSILDEGSGTFPTFSNLRTLLFDGCDLSDNFKILGCFLKNSPSLEKLSLQYCKLPEGSKKRRRMENPKRISLNCLDTLTFQCPNLKVTEIKYKEDDVHRLFGLLFGIWRNLCKTSIMLTKA